MELDYDFLATTFLLVLTAVPVTLKLTAVSLLFSAPFAFGIALLRRQAAGLLQRLAAAYVTFMRGTPMRQMYLRLLAMMLVRCSLMQSSVLAAMILKRSRRLLRKRKTSRLVLARSRWIRTTILSRAL